MKKTKALVAGSFDPITFGHLDIIERASNLYDEVIVAIGNNPDKKYLFTDTLRKELIVNAIETLFPLSIRSKISVVYFTGLLAEFAYHNNVKVIVRGIRNPSDLEGEMVLSNINYNLKGIETCFLPAKPQFFNVSSSICKAIVKERGNVQKYTTLKTKFSMETHINGTVLIGVSGGIGAGKSTICNNLIEEFNTTPPDHRDWLYAYHINLDTLAHKILDGDGHSPYCALVLEKLLDRFGSKIFDNFGKIIRKELSEIVFSNKEDLKFLNELMKDPIEHLLYETIRELSKKNTHVKIRVFLIESALLENAEWLRFVNNNVILVRCDKNIRIERACSRDSLDKDKILGKINAQLTDDDRMLAIADSIRKTGYGTLIEVFSEGNVNIQELKLIITKLISE